MGVIFGITALTWKLSSELEYRHKMPEPGQFFPSRQYVYYTPTSLRFRAFPSLYAVPILSLYLLNWLVLTVCFAAGANRSRNTRRHKRQRTRARAILEQLYHRVHIKLPSILGIEDHCSQKKKKKKKTTNNNTKDFEATSHGEYDVIIIPGTNITI